MSNDAQSSSDGPGNDGNMPEEFGGPDPDAQAVSNASSDIPHRAYRQPPALFAVAATMLVVLLVALVLATFAHGSMQKSATTGDTSTATATAGDMSMTTNAPTVAAPTSTIGSAGGAGGDGGNGGAEGTPPGNVPLQVTGISLTVDRSSLNGTCQDNNYFTFTLIVSIAPGSPGGLVSYTVAPSDSVVQQISSDLLFGSVDTSETATFGENIMAQYGDGATHWVQVQITSPNAIASQQVSFEATCVRQVTGATASVTPNVWNAPCARTQAFTFKFTITLTPGPPVTITFARNTSGGFAEWYPPTQTFSNFTGDSLTYSAGVGTLYSPSSGGGNGTYWQSITVTAPNSVTSNQATITEAC